MSVPTEQETGKKSLQSADILDYPVVALMSNCGRRKCEFGVRNWDDVMQ
jgi:hypothetical protein